MSVLRMMILSGAVVLGSGCDPDGGVPTPPVDQTPSEPSITPSEDRFNPDVYKNVSVSEANPYGLWVLVGDESMQISADGNSDTGNATRRMFFTLKPATDVVGAQARLCHMADAWLPADTDNIDTRGFDIAFSDDNTSLQYTFEFLNPDGTKAAGPTNRMSVVFDFDYADEDSSTMIDGTYTAIHISNDASADLGSISPTVSVIDYDQFTGGEFTMQPMYDGTGMTVECVNDVEADFVGVATSDLSGVQPSLQDILNRMERFNRTRFSVSGGEFFEFGVITTDVGSEGFLTLATNDSVNPSIFVSIGGVDLNTYTYQQNNNLGIDGQVQSTNHLGESANITFATQFFD